MAEPSCFGATHQCPPADVSSKDLQSNRHLLQALSNLKGRIQLSTWDAWKRQCTYGNLLHPSCARWTEKSTVLSPIDARTQKVVHETLGETLEIKHESSRNFIGLIKIMNA